MSEKYPQIPVYPTLSPRALLSWGKNKSRRMFPFSYPSGMWTFSGRVALYYGLPSLDIPENCTILFPSYFQGVEVDTLLTAGYKLSYYRIAEDLSIDFNDLEARMEKDIKALYIIHYFGFPQPLEKVNQFCKDHNLKLIEDCALSLFSRDSRDWLGLSGDLSLFSVYKTIPLPHGGFLVTRKRVNGRELKSPPFMSSMVQTKDLIHKNLNARGLEKIDKAITAVTGAVRSKLRWDRGQTISSGGSHWDRRLLGYGSSRIVQGLMQGVDPEDIVRKRRRNYKLMISILKDQVKSPFPEIPDGVCPLFFPIYVEDKPGFQNELLVQGIESVNLWFEPHPHCTGKQAEEAAVLRNHLHEIPIHQDLSEEDVVRVARAILRILS